MITLTIGRLILYVIAVLVVGFLVGQAIWWNFLKGDYKDHFKSH